MRRREEAGQSGRTIGKNGKFLYFVAEKGRWHNSAKKVAKMPKIFSKTGKMSRQTVDTPLDFMVLFTRCVNRMRQYAYWVETGSY